MSISLLPLEILDIIFDYLDLRSQIQFRTTCRLFREFDITNFWDTDGLIESSKITTKILKLYPKIRYLNLRDNRKVSDINFLTKVVKINVSGFCTMPDSGISKLKNLVYLNSQNNRFIKNLSKKKKIKYLNANGYCGINSDNIKHLDLIEFKHDQNENFDSQNSVSEITLQLSNSICNLLNDFTR
jgi:hypothetical protein